MKNLIFAFSILFQGCAHDFPASVCAEYMGIRRESKNFVFCKAGLIYDKNERHYIRRQDDILPDE